MKSKLIRDFSASAKTLLLFSQNVESVKLCVIPPTGSPTSMQEICSVSKKPLKFFRTIDNGTVSSQNSVFKQQCNVLKLASSVVKNQIQNQNRNVCSVIVEITTKDKERSEAKDQWLVTSCVGLGESLNFARCEEGRKLGILKWIIYFIYHCNFFFIELVQTQCDLF